MDTLIGSNQETIWGVHINQFGTQVIAGSNDNVTIADIYIICFGSYYYQYCYIQ
jgi:hypothetical protein